MQGKVGEVKTFPPIINVYIEWREMNIFQRGQSQISQNFSPVEISILIHLKQISVVLKSDKQNKTKQNKKQKQKQIK